MRIPLLAYLCSWSARGRRLSLLRPLQSKVIDGDRPAHAGALSVPELNGFHDTVFQEDVTMILVD